MTAINKFLCDACQQERDKPITAFYEAGDITAWGLGTEFDICKDCDQIIRMTIKSLVIKTMRPDA